MQRTESERARSQGGLEETSEMPLSVSRRIKQMLGQLLGPWRNASGKAWSKEGQVKLKDKIESSSLCYAAWCLTRQDNR